MGLRDIVKAVAPWPVVEYVRMRRAKDEHAEYMKIGKQLPQDLLENTKLFAHRDLMLEHMPKGGVVAEVGVAQGGFSRKILDACKPDKLYLIDPWDADDPRYSEQSYFNIQKNMAAEIASGQVELKRGYSTDVLDAFEENALDWIYVDAAHDYANVKLDLHAAKRVVKQGGLIAGDDYVRWVSPHERFGVQEALHEFMIETGSPMRFLTNQLDKHDNFAIELRK